MIDDTIQHLESQLEKYKELNDNLIELDTKGDVRVLGPYPVEIIIHQENLTNPLLEVADMDMHTNRVEYIQEEDRDYDYRLKFSIRPDP